MLCMWETQVCFGFGLFLFCFLLFWVTPSDAQGLLLALHSGIAPGSAWGTIWDAGDRTQVGCVQGKRPPRCAMAPAPVLLVMDAL